MRSAHVKFVIAYKMRSDDSDATTSVVFKFSRKTAPAVTANKKKAMSVRIEDSY